VGGRIKSSMELGHTEAIKQAVMAGLGVSFVSIHAIRRELMAGQLRALRLRNLRIRRHFHIIHNEARTLSASARAFMTLLENAPAEIREARRAPRARRARRG
jgi:LysR family transcriptional regulator, low CO2-responsive transcriptional regulator